MWRELIVGGNGPYRETFAAAVMFLSAVIHLFYSCYAKGYAHNNAVDLRFPPK